VVKEMSHDAYIVDHIRMIDSSSFQLHAFTHFTVVYTSCTKRKHSVQVTRLKRHPNVDVQIIDARMHQ
jgi:hypothetical protein